MAAAVGATRPPVDEGWAFDEQMIGRSGKTIRPRLYIGVGISGMSHHVVGMDGSEPVVAINSDPQAPLFKVADICITGDFREIIPPSWTKSAAAWGQSSIEFSKVSPDKQASPK